MRGHRVVNSCCMPGRCPAILMTTTRCAPSSKPLRGYRPRDRACLCRQGIPRPRCPKPAPRLHLRPKTRGLRPHQTRAQTALRHRGGDRTYMKAEGHLGRCYLKGRAGDAANIILSAVGYNLRLVLAWLRMILRVVLLALLQAFAIRLYKPDF